MVLYLLLVRCWLTSPQLYIVSDNGEIKEEDLDLLEKQILGGLWK